MLNYKIKRRIKIVNAIYGRRKAFTEVAKRRH